MGDGQANVALIEVNIQSIHQLFNSMDPSPFIERDLDHDAEEFIVSWAQEHPKTAEMKLVVHLVQKPEHDNPTKLLTDSIHHFFAYKAESNHHAFRQLMREGWISLLIGLSFLVACVIISHTLAPHLKGWQQVMKEGLTIMGWVAMWRPIEIYLYRWWPLRSLGRIYARLSTIPVDVRLSPGVNPN